MEERTLQIKAEDGNLQEVLRFLDAALEECGCPMKAQMQLEIAVEELFVNIARYAYPNEVRDAEVSIAVEENGIARVTFSDSGVPYDPLAKPDPDISLSADERPIGGLGIYMVKKSMDDMRYERRDGKNILSVFKKIR